MTVPPLGPSGGGAGGPHHKSVPQYHSVNQLRLLRRLVKFFFCAFGAWYFLCFLGHMTVPHLLGGGGALQEGGGACRGGGDLRLSHICPRQTRGRSHAYWAPTIATVLWARLWLECCRLVQSHIALCCSLGLPCLCSLQRSEA